jgi:hypothetical protein
MLALSKSTPQSGLVKFDERVPKSPSQKKSPGVTFRAWLGDLQLKGKSSAQ